MSSDGDQHTRVDNSQVTIPIVLESGGTPPPTAPPARGLSTLGARYVPLRPHARGGLGEVFVARDEELGREVALKTIQRRYAHDPDNQSRFIREAQITGILEHPGIVPVYGLGRSPDGQPYYAMRFIQGESLEHSIARFHAADRPGRDPGERTMSLLRLLGCFLDACNAVDYAHSRGILHRDLKPSNIMLGEHGETLVVDWGLAKCLHDAEEGPAEEGRRPPHTAVTESSRTLPGSQVGTPAFMSPEQAAGRVEAVGPASDIYNLGATLYCLLTGRSPFENVPTAELLAKVQRGDFPPPHAVAAARIPPALEAICFKAMAARPEDRYPTARALGEEIQRWIAHEPVAAYSESLAERLVRWSRRHRTWVLAGATALLGMLLVLATATVLVLRAWKHEQAERFQSQRLSTSLDLDQGLSLFQEGATARGMLRLAHALSIAPARGAADLRQTILANLAAWRRPLSPLREILPHQDAVLAVAYAPDGRSILTGSSIVISGVLRGEVRLWDSANGQALGPPLRHPGPIRCVAFSPDGRTIVAGSADRSAQLWNAATGAPLGPPLIDQEEVVAVAFSPDGRMLLTAAGRSVHFWDAATRQPLPSLPDHPAAVRALALSPDGQRVLTGSEDGIARLWDVVTRQPFGAPLVHQRSILAVAFSPDGKTVLTGGDAGLVRFWDVATGQNLLQRLAHPASVYSVAFSPDGRTILTGSEDNTARLWDAATGTLLGIPLEHGGSVMAVAFSPDGKRVLTGSGDASARLWDLPRGQLERAILAHPERVLAVAYRPDGKAFVTGGSDRTAWVWDANQLRSLGPPLVHPGEVRAVAFSPDRTMILTGCSDGRARLWSAATHQPLGPALEHLGSVTAVAFSPDGKRILTSSDDATARFWETATGRAWGAPLPQPTGATAAAFGPDGSIVVVAAGSRAQVWEVATRRPVGGPLAHHGAISSVAFHPDGRILITGGQDNTVLLWETATGRRLGEPLEHPASVVSVAFSPDGQTIVTGCNDHKIRLWNAATRKPIGPPLEHRGRIPAVAFSPDGRTVLSGSLDRTARLWDVPTALEDDAEQIGLWVQVLTGMALDTGLTTSGAVQLMNADSWYQCRHRLEHLGGPPLP